jgi:hypothetical protein
MPTKLAIAYVLKRERLEGTATTADLFSPEMEVEIEDFVKSDMQQIATQLTSADQKTAIELSFADSDAFSLRANSLLTMRDRFTVLFSSPCATYALPDRISELLSRARAEGGRILPVRSDSGVWTAVQVDFDCGSLHGLA